MKNTDQETRLVNEEDRVWPSGNRYEVPGHISMLAQTMNWIIYWDYNLLEWKLADRKLIER